MRQAAMVGTLGFALCVSAAAVAGGGGGRGGGKVHSTTSAAACPPGLAGKSPACVPPGQARGGGSDDAGLRVITTAPQPARPTTDPEVYADGTTRTRQLTEITAPDGHIYRIGDRLNRDWSDEYRVIDRPAAFDLPPLVGSDRYLRIGDTAARIDPETRELIELIALISIIID
ncbi:hypothetical protein [Mesobaculum littorinae]|nr:hypothetical protein [Mesobaculum littorinae]